MRAVGQAAIDRPALQHHPRASGVPGAGAGLVVDEPGVTQLGHVGVTAFPVLGQALFRREPEDAPGVFLQNLLAADVGIVPVEHIDVAARADLHAETDPLRVVGLHEILVVFADKPGTAWHQFIGQHRVLVDVGHEDFAVILVREGVGQIHPRTAVRRAVAVIGDRSDVAVNVRVEMPAALPVIHTTRDDVPQVRDHAGADEELALRVVVNAPRVAEAVRDHLEAILHRVIPPDAAVDRRAFAVELDRFRVRFARLENAPFAPWPADDRRRENALAAVQPAVRSPVETVDHLVPVANAPTGQAHLDVVDVRPVIAVAVRDK